MTQAQRQFSQNRCHFQNNGIFCKYKEHFNDGFHEKRHWNRKMMTIVMKTIVEIEYSKMIVFKNHPWMRSIFIFVLSRTLALFHYAHFASINLSTPLSLRLCHSALSLIFLRKPQDLCFAWLDSTISPNFSFWNYEFLSFVFILLGFSIRDSLFQWVITW